MKNSTAMSAAVALLFAVPAFAQDADMMEPPESCAQPGQTILVDPEGDAVIAAAPSPVAAKDLTELTIAQVVDDAGEPQLVFRLKVAEFDVDPLPQSTYFSSFLSPTGAYRGVRMEVDAEGNVAYYTYQPSPDSNGDIDGNFAADGSLVPTDPASHYTADGEIFFVVKPERVGLLFPGDQLTGFNAGSITFAGVAGAGVSFPNDSMPDGLSRRGTYTYIDTSVDCPADADAPAAKLAVSHTSGNAPLTVQFDASQSQAKDGSALSYTFNFGDNSPEVTSQLPYATHTYVSQGLYTAALTVTDTSGREDYATTDIAAGVVPAQSRSTATVAGGALGWMLLALGGLGLARRRR